MRGHKQLGGFTKEVDVGRRLTDLDAPREAVTDIYSAGFLNRRF